jgi:hypothetical protein
MAIDPQGYPLQQFLNLSNQAALSILSNGPLILINGVTISTGTGSPQGVVTAPPSSLYFQIDGAVGSFWWQKQSGTGNSGWVAAGGGGVSGTPSSPGPGSKSLVVDGARTDSYTADGSPAFPFKTIMAAVNKIIANGDNATHPYIVIVNPWIYVETLDFSNTQIHTINFWSGGWGFEVEGLLTPVQVDGGGANFLQCVNNDSCNVTFIGFGFRNGGMNLDDSGSAGNSQIIWNGCFLSSGFAITWKSFNLTLNYTSVQMNVTVSITSCTVVASNSSLLAGAVWAISGSSNVIVDAGCTVSIPFTVAGTAFLTFTGGTRTVTAGVTITVSTGATLQVKNSFMGASTITIQSGGTLTFQDGVLTGAGTITINAGATMNWAGGTIASLSNAGTLNLTGSEGTGNLILGTAAPTVGTGQVGLGAITAATATAGAATLPANPTGFLIINVAGATQKIPYYNA